MVVVLRVVCGIGCHPCCDNVPGSIAFFDSVRAWECLVCDQDFWGELGFKP